MLSVKGEFSENRPKRRSHFTESCKMSFSPYFPQFVNDFFFKFGIDYLHAITPSDYEFHVIWHSDSYILLSNISEILSEFLHL